MRAVLKLGDKVVVFGVSEFEAEVIRDNLVGVDGVCGGDQFLNRGGLIIYRESVRKNFCRRMLLRRCCVALGKKFGVKFVYFDDLSNVVKVGGMHFLLVDKVESFEERKYYEKKHNDCVVVSLNRTYFAPWLKFDTETIRQYYEDVFVLDPKFVKMRAFKVVDVNNKWYSSGRRLNNTSKSSSEEKFNKQFNVDIGAAYYSLARVLDSKLEGKGRGRPIDRVLLAFDIDADKDHHIHKIAGEGVCVDCFKSAFAKVKKVVGIVGGVGRWFFSGTKGFHLYFDREVSEREYLDMLNLISENESLVDDFSYITKNGDQRFDMHRIFKIPGSVDATTGCVVAELPINRLLVRDEIMYLK